MSYSCRKGTLSNETVQLNMVCNKPDSKVKRAQWMSYRTFWRRTLCISSSRLLVFFILKICYLFIHTVFCSDSWIFLLLCIFLFSDKLCFYCLYTRPLGKAVVILIRLTYLTNQLEKKWKKIFSLFIQLNQHEMYIYDAPETCKPYEVKYYIQWEKSINYFCLPLHTLDFVFCISILLQLDHTPLPLKPNPFLSPL